MSSLFSNLYHLTIAAGTTISLALLSVFFGLILAILLTLWESVKVKPIAFLGSSFVTLVRGLPEIIVVLFVYYGLANVSLIIADFLDEYIATHHAANEAALPFFIAILSNVNWEFSPFTCGVIALSFLYAAYASQTLRGAIKAIPSGQSEAGDALGLSRSAIFIRIIMPQMWRHALPGLGNQWLVLLKDTALVSLISVNDIMLQAKSIITNISQQNSPFVWYMIAALIYLLISMFSQYVLKDINRRANHYMGGGN